MKGETAIFIVIALAVIGAGVYFFIIVPRRVGADSAAQPSGMGFVDTANPNRATADGSSGRATYVPAISASPEAIRKATALNEAIHARDIPTSELSTSTIERLSGKTATPLPPVTNATNLSPASLPKVNFAGIAAGSLATAWNHAETVKPDAPIAPPPPIPSGIVRSPSLLGSTLPRITAIPAASPTWQSVSSFATAPISKPISARTGVFQ